MAELASRSWWNWRSITSLPCSMRSFSTAPARSAAALEKRHGIPYPRYLPRMKRMNRFDAQRLYLAPEPAGAHGAGVPA